MRVLYSFLCEEAESRRDGRVDARGIFTHLFARGYPAMQDRLVLVAEIEWGAEERGTVDFAVDLLDPSRSPVGTISGRTEVREPPSHEPPPRTVLSVPLTDVVFPSAGTYAFELRVGDEQAPLAVLHQIENPDVS